MKLIGLIGGLGPESTIGYYQSIIHQYRERVRDGSYPPLVINSVNLQRGIDLVTANNLRGLTDFLVEELWRLQRAGADIGALTANTPHIVFDKVRKGSPIPLISIVEATCNAARCRGLKRLALIGTRFTMQATFYRDVFSRESLSLIVPDAEAQDFIHDKYMNELVRGVFRPETHDALLRTVDRLIENEKIDGLILGGTELPLILTEAEYRGIPFLDTTRIHVDAILTEALWDTAGVHGS